MKKIIATDKAPAAIGPYSQAVEVNGLIFTSGVIPIVPATGELVQGGIEEQADQAIGNLAALIEASGARVEDTIKTVVFIKNMDDFGKVNEIYSKYFKTDCPARSCVEVARLPKDVLIEIEAIVAKNYRKGTKKMDINTLQKDMIAAMKAKDKERKAVISDMYSAAKKLAIDEGKRDDIPDELVDRAILKELKTVKEQVETCPAERQDLLDEYKFRLAVITEYAPKMLSVEEVEEILTTQFAEVIATKNKGQIMKAVMAELKGKADGKVINQVVGKLCQ